MYVCMYVFMYVKSVWIDVVHLFNMLSAMKINIGYKVMLFL